MISDTTSTPQIRAGVRSRPPWRHDRKLRRESDRVQREIRLTVIKLDALEKVGQLILTKITGLSKGEAALVLADSTDSERCQYVIDKITQATGVEVDDLIRRWKA